MQSNSVLIPESARLLWKACLFSICSPMPHIGLSVTSSRVTDFPMADARDRPKWVGLRQSRTAEMGRTAPVGKVPRADGRGVYEIRGDSTSCRTHRLLAASNGQARMIIQDALPLPCGCAVGCRIHYSRCSEPREYSICSAVVSHLF